MDPTAQGIQYTFPNILDGSSFRVPQGTNRTRLQFADALDLIVGNHSLKVGGIVFVSTVIISVLGTLVTYLMVSPRVYLAMAEVDKVRLTLESFEC